MLEDHHRILRDAFAEFGGREVDTQGDAFFVSFARTREAVAAAVAGQRALAKHAWPDDVQVRVRMGIHTGEPTLATTGYVGIDVHRGSRICGAAHGGQVLCSETTRALLDQDVALLDLGEQRLKDLAQPVRLYQVLADGLPRVFPPPRTLNTRLTNLPIQPTPLVGREDELAEIAAVLRKDEVRLLTLVGTGGTGKTRLALQVVADLLDDFPGGGFLVALAPIKDPNHVIPEIGQALGLGGTDLETIARYLEQKRLLLLLDNFEQVVDAAGQVASLLAAAPGLKVLATSRTPLQLSAERLFPVPTMSENEARALFVERALSVKPDFSLTDKESSMLGEICDRLDRLPLALELAAARVALVSPAEMLDRLGDRLKLLSGGRRDLPERQRSLRAAIEWSHDLLGDEEQQLFARFAVFSGGCTLDSAESVCDTDLEHLALLVDYNLVRRQDERMMMLETVREYATERLADADEADEVRDRHANHYLALAEDLYPTRWEREVEYSDRLERENDNLRAALSWFSARDIAKFVRLAGSLGWFWHVRSHMSEGREWLADALARYAEGDAHRGRALLGAGEIAAWQGDLDNASRYLGEALTLWRELGDRQEEALVLHELGWAHFFAGGASRSMMEESLELQRQLGNPALINRAQVGLTQVLVSLHEVEAVEPLANESLAIARAQGDIRSEHFSIHFLADCALIKGECELAEERYVEALRAAQRLGDQSEAAVEMQGIAMAAAGRLDHARALALAGAAAAELESLSVDLSGMTFWMDLLSKYLGKAEVALGKDALAATQRGREMDFETAVEEALDPARP
ncbi:MAG: hypothetical protein QOH26_1753 [Actinomycetota bacterium]|nr:hypothetical protein [Actinomycetota bacterium]